MDAGLAASAPWPARLTLQRPAEGRLRAELHKTFAEHSMRMFVGYRGPACGQPEARKL